jgi:hypothetical protein
MEEKPLVTPVDPQTLAPEKNVSDFHHMGSKSPLILFFIVIIAGIFTGYIISRRFAGPASGNITAGKDIINTGSEVGSTDTTTFRDTAQGTLEAGGSNGEGTHKLIRPGGASQTVYLISSIIDLDTYVGKQVEIWGETLKAQKVGWLMDVGRLKILE